MWEWSYIILEKSGILIKEWKIWYMKIKNQIIKNWYNLDLEDALLKIKKTENWVGFEFNDFKCNINSETGEITL